MGENEELRSQEEEVKLGLRLKEAREFLGFSQEAVSKAMDLRRATISALESGKRKVSANELKRFAKLYRRPTEFFLSDGVVDEDKGIEALFRITKDLTDADKDQVLKFAQFLSGAGKPSKMTDEQ